MEITIILTIEKISEKSVRVSIGGDNICTLPKSMIKYNEEELEVGAEIEITMSEKLAVNKGLE